MAIRIRIHVYTRRQREIRGNRIKYRKDRANQNKAGLAWAHTRALFARGRARTVFGRGSATGVPTRDGGWLPSTESVPRIRDARWRVTIPSAASASSALTTSSSASSTSSISSSLRLRGDAGAIVVSTDDTDGERATIVALLSADEEVDDCAELDRFLVCVGSAKVAGAGAEMGSAARGEDAEAAADTMRGERAEGVTFRRTRVLDLFAG